VRDSCKRGRIRRGIQGTHWLSVVTAATAAFATVWVLPEAPWRIRWWAASSTGGFIFLLMELRRLPLARERWKLSPPGFAGDLFT
jgi:hypothetical protein